MSSFRPRAVDWCRGAGRGQQQRPTAIDIIVPVYGAAAELARCLASVRRETDLAIHRLLLVIDGPQESAVERAIESVAELAVVLRNESRRGFVGSVNRGMQHSSRDVVLLNSDTVVTSRWIEKLIDAATSCGDAGTVTPLSNHATLCSVPYGFAENFLPSGHDAVSFAALIERISRRLYPRLPTGVGVCLYIRRALLDDIGLFDESQFGLGYGEENDFCMRALQRGWLHLADDATFIEHAGSRSFGESRRPLQKKASRRLQQMHPSYLATIAAFMKDDPLEPVRSAIRETLCAESPRHETTRQPKPLSQKVLHVVHGWPPFQHAGTELYAWWLVRQQLQWREVAVFTRLDDRGRAEGETVEWFDAGARVRLVTNNFTQRDPLARNAIRNARLERSFEEMLRQERPSIVHIHHLAGHSFSLSQVARRLGIPVVQQLQDWWALCARVNFFDAQWQRCSGPGIDKCARCAPLTAIAPAVLWNRVLHGARHRAARASLAVADAYVMGSHFIQRDYAAASMLRESVPHFVLPYGVELQATAPRRARSGGVLRFGVVGSILPHKGLHVAVQAFRSIDPSRAKLHAWGDTTASPAYTQQLREDAGESLQFEGTFAERDKEAIFASLDALLVPSVGLESFGLAAREAMVCGVPVIAANDGALTELFAFGSEGGALFPNGDAAALEVIIRRIVADPSLLDLWSSQIAPPLAVAEHAMEIERVYEQLLAGRR